MSALTDLFSSMANKIRSKTGTATTYTPPQMVSDGIDDVFDAGVASATTPITPSNSSPVAMSANTGYKPTTSGYAISSYSSVTPSSSQVAVASGDVVKIGGSGVIVNSVPTPTNLTPSNSSPATITSGGLYSATAGGKAIASYRDILPTGGPNHVSPDEIIHIMDDGEVVDAISSITPSNTSPVDIASGMIYKADGNGKAVETITDVTMPTSTGNAISLTNDKIYKFDTTGYAIRYFTNVTPQDAAPFSLTQGQYARVSSAGYIVKTVSHIGLEPDKVYTSDSNGTSGTTTISVTQKPRYAFVSAVTTNNSNYFYMILVDFTKNKAWRFARNGSSTITNTDYSSSISTMFPTVSSSSVVFQNNSINSTKRLFIALYY